MKIKKLEEARAELLEQIEVENTSETRSIEKIDELLTKVDEINEQIKKEEELEERLLKATKGEVKTMTKELEVRNYEMEIREAIELGRELDVTNFEVEERTIGMAQGDKTVGNIAKKSFANAIIKKATETSDLYAYVRKENLGTALHQIPVQKDKVGKFANVQELAQYAEKNVDFTPVNLSAYKFGAISVISEEALADSGYNLMAELIEQYGEGAGETLDELLVKGNVVGVQGLESFSNNGVGQDGAKVVEVAVTDFDDALIESIFKAHNALPQKYRKNATWVIGTELAGKLAMATDGVGRPLLTTDFSQLAFNGKATPMLLGRPVVISDHVKNITGGNQHDQVAFFGDLSKALVLGIRQNFTIKSSTEYAFIRDGVAIKGTIRADAKRCLGESMVVVTRGA